MNLVKGQYKKIGGYIVTIGSIIGVLMGILGLFGVVFALSIGLLTPQMLCAIRIILSLIVLATSGIIEFPALRMEKNWLLALILGITIMIMGDYLGGIIIVIGAVVMWL